MATLERLQSDSKRAEIIELRFKGHTLKQVGERLGMTLQGVKYHEDAWLAEQKPSAEVTESRRQLQLASIDAVRMRLFAALESEVDLSARLAVVDRLAKLWEREAKLAGLDLERGAVVGVLLPSAEQVAIAYGWDPQPVIEGSAVELEAGESA